MLPPLVAFRGWYTPDIAKDSCSALDRFAVACIVALALAQRAAEFQAKQAVAEDLRVAAGKALVASQAAHDIRSPLAALNVVFYNIDSSLDADARALMETSMRRLTDMCDTLRLRGETLSEAEGFVAVRAPLYGTVRDILHEHLARHGQDPNVHLGLKMPRRHEAVQVIAGQADLGRLVSNLLNNAVEAARSSGRAEVMLQVSTPSGSSTIEIIDNGPGIDDAVLARLGEVGNTLGKSAGQGLGLSQAVRLVADWGGTFDIGRMPTGGTRAVVRLKNVPLVS